MTGYTVIDLETTGLFPQKHDRVVEVGVVHLSDVGEPVGEWTTLVNPQRDVGPTSLHGISARDVLDAPTFADVAPALIQSIAGRTIVAHNARFDLQFLDYEFERAGIGTRPPSPGLCTMEWSAQFLRASSRKLTDCCGAAGVRHEDAHSALGDARAAAGLLRYYLSASGVPVPWSDLVTHTRGYWWPSIASDTSPALRGRNSTFRRPDAWLERISSHLPRNDDPVVEAYLDVLEQAMLDRYLSVHEEEALTEVALALGLQRDQLTALHSVYLDGLAAAAVADGIVTDDELQELNDVAAMLGLPRQLVPVALRRAEQVGVQSTGPSLQLQPGDRVVFTGELSVPRDEWVARAESVGLVHGGVTKTTKVVVAADPDSQSGKAAKARSFNVPVITESAFVRIFEAMASVG